MSSLEVNDDLLAPTEPIIDLSVKPAEIHWLNLVNDAIHTSDYLSIYTQVCRDEACEYRKTPQPSYPNPFSGIIRSVVSNYDTMLNNPQCPEYLSAFIREFKDCLDPKPLTVTGTMINSAFTMAYRTSEVLNKEYVQKQEAFRKGPYASQWQNFEKRYKKRPNYNIPTHQEFRTIVVEILKPSPRPSALGIQTNPDVKLTFDPIVTPTVEPKPTNEIIAFLTGYINTNQDTIIKVVEAAKAVQFLLNPTTVNVTSSSSNVRNPAF